MFDFIGDLFTDIFHGIANLLESVFQAIGDILVIIAAIIVVVIIVYFLLVTGGLITADGFLITATTVDGAISYTLSWEIVVAFIVALIIGGETLLEWIMAVIEYVIDLIVQVVALVAKAIIDKVTSSPTLLIALGIGVLLMMGSSKKGNVQQSPPYNPNYDNNRGTYHDNSIIMPWEKERRRNITKEVIDDRNDKSAEYYYA